MAGRKTYKGKFKPLHPEKYRGNLDNIVFRSLWERQVMKQFDEHPSVISWGSESFPIPYLFEVDGKVHNYWPDFIVEIKEDSGKIVKYIVEVKPYHETIPPVPGKKKSKTYTDQVLTWLKNSAKWREAEAFCKKNDMKFIKLTERQLFNKK